MAPSRSATHFGIKSAISARGILITRVTYVYRCIEFYRENEIALFVRDSWEKCMSLDIAIITRTYVTL